MHRMLLRGSIIALILGGAAFAQSQADNSLGEVARANRAKQQTQQASGSAPKVITNQDLSPNSTPIPESSDAMTEVSGVNHPNRFADQQLSNRLAAEQRNAGQWRARIQEQENRIADLQARIDHVNAAIRNAVGTAQYDTPANRYQAIQSERLAAMQLTLEQQKRKLAMMEDAARRAGMEQ